MAENSNSQAITAVIIAIAVGVLISLAGSDGGDRFGALPVFALCGALAFAINWLAFIPAAIARTEHFYDLTGGITYITVTAFAVAVASEDRRIVSEQEGATDRKGRVVRVIVDVGYARIGFVQCAYATGNEAC